MIILSVRFCLGDYLTKERVGARPTRCQHPIFVPAENYIDFCGWSQEYKRLSANIVKIRFIKSERSSRQSKLRTDE